MGKTVNEIEQLERTLDKESITFKELKEGILKYKAKSEYQQAAIIIIRGVLEERLHENSGLHKHGVKASFSNKYGFLYWCENDTTADDGRCKWIEASTLDEACEKFLKKAPKTLRQIDYEVQLGDNYIDISERADFKNWL